MKFTLYHSDSRETPANCTYMHKVEVTDKDTLLRAVAHDYVCAEYKDGYRSNDNFLGSDCLPVDCDNDHSEDPEAWVYPSDVANAFPGVAFAVHYSRNHMKMKAGKAARPKFHVFFAIARVTDAGQYSELKKWKKETQSDRLYHINWIPTLYLIAPDGRVALATVMMDKVEAELAKALGD